MYSQITELAHWMVTLMLVRRRIVLTHLFYSFVIHDGWSVTGLWLALFLVGVYVAWLLTIP